MRSFQLSVLAACAMSSGCAAIVNGTNQVVSVETRKDDQPVQGATCKLANSKGTYYVNTPGTVTINRAYGDLSVRCDKAEMEAGLATVKSTTKAMAFGNILFGGAIGVAVDTASGAAYDYPEVIMVRMGTNSVVSIPTVAGGLGHTEVSLPAASGYADINNVDAVPYERARRGYTEYLARKAPKAFVLADGGHYAFWSNNKDAIEKAMGQCRDKKFTACRLYAYDDVVVWPRGAGTTQRLATKEASPAVAGNGTPPAGTTPALTGGGGPALSR